MLPYKISKVVALILAYLLNNGVGWKKKYQKVIQNNTNISDNKDKMLYYTKFSSIIP